MGGKKENEGCQGEGGKKKKKSPVKGSLLSWVEVHDCADDPPGCSGKLADKIKLYLSLSVLSQKLELPSKPV